MKPRRRWASWVHAGVAVVVTVWVLVTVGPVTFERGDVSGGLRGGWHGVVALTVEIMVVVSVEVAAEAVVVTVDAGPVTVVVDAGAVTVVVAADAVTVVVTPDPVTVVVAPAPVTVVVTPAPATVVVAVGPETYRWVRGCLQVFPQAGQHGTCRRLRFLCSSPSLWIW